MEAYYLLRLMTKSCSKWLNSYDYLTLNWISSQNCKMCPSDTFANYFYLAKVDVYVESTHFPKIFARKNKR